MFCVALCFELCSRHFCLHSDSRKRQRAVLFAWTVSPSIRVVARRDRQFRLSREHGHRSLYPESSSTYFHPSGASYDVPCSTQDKEVVASLADCPDGFVNPIDPNHIKPCVKPCPAAAFSDKEYSIMWLIGGIVGLFGLVLNIFMVLTWYLGRKRQFKHVQYQLKDACTCTCVQPCGDSAVGDPEIRPAVFGM